MMFIRISILFAILQLASAQEFTSSEIEAAMSTRLKEPGIKETIFGALCFLEDRQIRQRRGKLSSEYDSCEEGDGCKGVASLNLPFKKNIAFSTPDIFETKNMSGEWASYIHFLPNKLGFSGRSVLALQDSNLFMTAFIGYPLFLFDETLLPPGKHHIDQMLKRAAKNILSFKRGTSYNFWTVLPGVKSPATRTGPLNIPVEHIELFTMTYLDPGKWKRTFRWLERGQQIDTKDWSETCLDMQTNPTGADAIFNLPNDADDTSIAVAFEYLYAKRFPNSSIKPDIPALREVSRYRDIGRKKEESRDSWKGGQTGAFLTWFKDENIPVFQHPEDGIIPLGINNVDAVVNSNVLFALSLTDNQKLPGYRSSIGLVSRVIDKHLWPEAGLYYPQRMIFPYTVTRAWRDGGARGKQMRIAMKKLLKDLLKEQQEWGQKQTKHKGAFPGGVDKSDHLSTALGVTSLINIGRGIAKEEGLEKEYGQAIKAGISYLLRSCKWEKPCNNSTIGSYTSSKGECATWDSGLFFASSFMDLSHWRSRAFTVSMALEALTKYALAYDMDLVRMGDRRIKLTKKARLVPER